MASATSSSWLQSSVFSRCARSAPAQKSRRDQLGVEGVSLLGAVERDGRDAGRFVNLIEDEVSHYGRA
jgi:hypothetical protein